MKGNVNGSNNKTNHNCRKVNSLKSFVPTIVVVGSNPQIYIFNEFDLTWLCPEECVLCYCIIKPYPQHKKILILFKIQNDINKLNFIENRWFSWSSSCWHIKDNYSQLYRTLSAEENLFQKGLKLTNDQNYLLSGIPYLFLISQNCKRKSANIFFKFANWKTNCW